MLLAQGKCIYFNKKDNAVDYFRGIGFPCPELANPADYFMSIMSIESIEDELDPSKVQSIYDDRIKKFNDEYQKSELKNDPNSYDSNSLDKLDTSQFATTSWLY